MGCQICSQVKEIENSTRDFQGQDLPDAGEVLALEEVQSSRVQYKKVPIGERLPDSCSDSDSEAAEDYLMAQNKFRRKSSINMPVPFTEAIIKRLSTGGIRPD